MRSRLFKSSLPRSASTSRSLRLNRVVGSSATQSLQAISTAAEAALRDLNVAMDEYKKHTEHQISSLTTEINNLREQYKVLQSKYAENLNELEEAHKAADEIRRDFVGKVLVSC
jgi:chromosome segregation ATPase